MELSMLEYLASLRRYGHTPETLGTARIGRTEYVFGRFVSPERDAPTGSRAALEGRRVPAQVRLALAPYTGSRLLPPAYTRRPNATRFVDARGGRWYVSGWHVGKGVFWLDQTTRDVEPGEPEPTLVRLDLSETEPFDSALRLAGNDVLSRIDAEEFHAPETTAHVAYVSRDGRSLTTWTGEPLARVVSHAVSRSGFHGSEVHAYRFRDDDGREWYGRNAGAGMDIRVRRARRSTR